MAHNRPQPYIIHLYRLTVNVGEAFTPFTMTQVVVQYGTEPYLTLGEPSGRNLTMQKQELPDCMPNRMPILTLNF